MKVKVGTVYVGMKALPTRAWLSIAAGLFALTPALLAAAPAAPLLIDDFESADNWRVIASEGVQASIAEADGHDGGALRFDYDFQSGAGFCVIRRDVALDLPPNYRFALRLRGTGPPNNFEFKLIDPTGENVWWVNRRAYVPPAEWQLLSQRARHFKFAWGPAGNAPLKRIGAIEFAIAASSGGRGSIWLDRLTFEQLPVPQLPSSPPWVQVSSHATTDRALAWDVTSAGDVDWRSDPQDATPTLTADFGVVRELGGLRLTWNRDDYPTAYRVLLSTDQDHWEPAAEITNAGGGQRYVQLPDAEARYLRLAVDATSGGRGVALDQLVVLDVEFGASHNVLYQQVAHDAPRGHYPRYFLGEQPLWTVVGLPQDDAEALFNADGAIEFAAGHARLEPFLLLDGKLCTWADVETTTSLAEEYLPIPSVTWRTPELTLTMTALAEGEPGAANLRLRYRLQSQTTTPVEASLFLALRPFQVLPPWQDLNIVGGVAPITSIAAQTRAALIDHDRRIFFESPADAWGVSVFSGGDIVEHIARGRLPDAERCTDPDRLASAAWRYDVHLAPGKSQDVLVAIPLHAVRDGDANAAPGSFDAALARVSAQWQKLLNRVQLELPPAADHLVNTFRTTQAYILINMDGPAIQPGSRTYARSWIRDGALTSTALLYTGHVAPVHAFIDWFAPHQFDSGKVPCVVDQRGPDPVPEHDSTGQLIYLLNKYYEVTGDRAMLARHHERVKAGVDYLTALRAERLTAVYRDGSPEQRACYGLVPESISHEGYSAKPMHSYWDDFWVLQGLSDAAAIAETLDDAAFAARCRKIHSEFQKSLYDSLGLAMKTKQIDYIPGCVELGDFDATSTAIALYPCGQRYDLPAAALAYTFDRYYTFFEQRRAGTISWENYTPYEVRVIGTFVRLGQRERAHALIDFFLANQQPTAWNQWAEVTWRDPRTPKFIGDLPHTWVGSDFVSAVRSLFVYERAHDDALVLGSGVRPTWLMSDDGVTIRNFPTDYGTLTYQAWHELNPGAERPSLHLQLDATGEIPPGGFVLAFPGLNPGCQRLGEGAASVRVRGGELTLHDKSADLRFE